MSIPGVIGALALKPSALVTIVLLSPGSTPVTKKPSTLGLAPILSREALLKRKLQGIQDRIDKACVFGYSFDSRVPLKDQRRPLFTSLPKFVNLGKNKFGV